jgi:hypothetical protein
MIIIAEFRHLIAPAFPGLVNLLQDSYPDVRQAVGAALLQFSEQRVLIHPDYCLQDAFPIIFNILLSFDPADAHTVPICTRIFASHAFNGNFLLLPLYDLH